MEKDIFLLGTQYGNELSSYFFNADVFILPGAGGLAINEALAHGLPIVSTTGDGTIVDLLDQGVNGYFLEDNPSVENIYETCKRILTLSVTELNEMGKISNKICKEKASLKNMVSVFKSVIINELMI